MSKKTEFIAMFESVTGKTIDGNFDPKELAEILNGHLGLRADFLSAVQEAAENDENSAVTAGVSLLFPDPK